MSLRSASQLFLQQKNFLNESIKILFTPQHFEMFCSAINKFSKTIAPGGKELILNLS